MKKNFQMFFQILSSFFIALTVGLLVMVFLLPFVGLLDETLSLDFTQVTKPILWKLFSLFGMITIFLNLLFFMQKKLRLVGVFLLAFLAGGLFYIFNIPDIQKPQKTEIASVSSCEESKTLLRAKACTILVSGEYFHGSGFIINSQGYAVTNYHVIENSPDGYVSVTINGLQEKAYIVGFDSESDLGVIKTSKSGFSNCNWVDSSNLDLAENVFAVGWPNDPGGDSTITKGIFSRYVSFENGIRMIQTDTPINPGNSGGPLVNACGVVGINTSKISWIDDEAPSEGLGYAISSNYAIEIVNSIIEGDTGDPQIPTIKIGRGSASAPPSVEDTSPSPNEPVAYDFEQVLFWEERLALDKKIKDSWKDNVGSEFLNASKLSVLLSNLDRLVFLSEELWDGYTNSKITYQQADAYKDEYRQLNNDTAALTKELNYEGSINSFNACVESWESLEDEYDMDFSSQIDECDSYLDN